METPERRERNSSRLYGDGPKTSSEGEVLEMQVWFDHGSGEADVTIDKVDGKIQDLHQLMAPTALAETLPEIGLRTLQVTAYY